MIEEQADRNGDVLWNRGAQRPSSSSMLNGAKGEVRCCYWATYFLHGAYAQI